MKVPLLTKYARKKRIKIIKKYIIKNDLILDIGCGYDNFLHNELKEYNIIGIDLIKNANIICDIKYLPFKDNSFDKIIALEVIEHIDNTNDIKRVLKNDGYLLFSIPDEFTEFILNFLILVKLCNEKVTKHINFSISPNSLKMTFIKCYILCFGMDWFYIYKNNR